MVEQSPIPHNNMTPLLDSGVFSCGGQRFWQGQNMLDRAKLSPYSSSSD